MKHAMTAVLASFLLVCFSPVLSQEQAAEQTRPSKSICETAEHFNDFDFWVGEWNVYSNDDKKVFQGTNSVTRHHKNCLIMENWTSAQSGTGSSMNFYDAVEDQWRQLWVASGYSIDYTGGLDDSGAMVLEGRINYYKAGKTQPFKGTWTSKPDGTVRQLFELQDPDTLEWTVWFDGLYVRR